MKLVFYSGGQNPSNFKIHKALGNLARDAKKKGDLSFTYIPVCAESSSIFFKRIIKRYRRVGFSQFTSLPVDVAVSRALLIKAFEADVIYLAGGNTFYFLKHLKKNGMLAYLKKFSKNGGIIAGLSAGAILMTTDIELASYPPFDADENEVRLKRKDWDSLGLVKFRFFPHFEETSRLNKAFIDYSKQSKYRTYVCQDGGGILVNGKQLQFFGKVKYFENGQKFSCSKFKGVLK
jgi:dipeptidase E